MSDELTRERVEELRTMYQGGLDAHVTRGDPWRAHYAEHLALCSHWLEANRVARPQPVEREMRPFGIAKLMDRDIATPPQPAASGVEGQRHVDDPAQQLGLPEMAKLMELGREVFAPQPDSVRVKPWLEFHDEGCVKRYNAVTDNYCKCELRALASGGGK